jgi:hypothetical protein
MGSLSKCQKKTFGQENQESSIIFYNYISYPLEVKLILRAIREIIIVIDPETMKYKFMEMGL